MESIGQGEKAGLDRARVDWFHVTGRRQARAICEKPALLFSCFPGNLCSFPTFVMRCLLYFWILWLFVRSLLYLFSFFRARRERTMKAFFSYDALGLSLQVKEALVPCLFTLWPFVKCTIALR